MPNDKPVFGTIEKIARDDFEHAHRKAFWRSLASWFTRQENSLVPFDEVRRRLPLNAQHYIGLRQVAMERIIGSVGRYNDFDRAFLPRRTQTRGRWVSIDKAHLQDVILPPIEVYKTGEHYFVKDGNHRVSVARERGQAFIDAYVIEIDLTVPADPNISIDELIRRQEQADFMRRTRLAELRPDVDITLSLPGQYDRLYEHIQVHRWFMGERAGYEISMDDAVNSWVDQVYLPLVKVIRELGVLKEFPRRTEADLYLWVIEHLWYLRGDINRDVSFQDAAVHFVQRFSNRPLRRLINRFRRYEPPAAENPGTKNEPPEDGSPSS